MSGYSRRTVWPGQLLGLAPRGRVAAPLPLSFPNKNAADTLDYNVDFTAELDGDDELALAGAAYVTVVPQGPGAPSASTPTAAGNVVSFQLGGGSPGMNYTIGVLAALSNGGAVQAFIGLYINPSPFLLSQAGSPILLFF